jgi:hypothetical protein
MYTVEYSEICTSKQLCSYNCNFKTIISNNSVALVSKRTVPTERQPLVGEISANSCRQKVVSATDPYGSNLGFLDWSRYFFFQVALQMYSRS